MVGFLVSIIATAALVGLFFVYKNRRPPGYVMSWGEAMLLATFTFLVMFIAYGILPHQWLIWADNELNWRPDKILYGPGNILQPQEFGGDLPLTITYQTLRDLIAVIIYVVLLGINIWLWQVWNKRGTGASTEVEASTFGRPLVKEGA